MKENINPISKIRHLYLDRFGVAQRAKSLYVAPLIPSLNLMERKYSMMGTIISREKCVLCILGVENSHP